MSRSLRSTIEAGYYRVAGQYLATKNRQDPVALSVLEKLAAELRPKAAVLDLGCGAGVPATRWLAERFPVTGVGFSERQLELASRNAPAATFVKADMSEVRFEPKTFDAVVALYSIIHVPRSEHSALLRNIRRRLRPPVGFFW